MSTSVFPECDGQVTRVSTRSHCQDDSALFKISFDNEIITLPVTGFALEVGGNYQFLHTLNDFIYFYSFGERVGELNITGLAFIKRACNTGAGFDNQTWPSYLNPFNWNINPFSPDFANDPNWVQVKERFIGLNREPNSICDLWDFYRTNRASAKADAIKVMWGPCEAFYGFLTGMRVEIARPDLPVAQFVLRVHIVDKGN